MPRHKILLGASISIATYAVLINCAHSQQQAEGAAGKAEAPKKNEELTRRLGGDSRYQTFISTDKPIYKEGEKVYVRGIILNASNHKPLPNSQSNVTIQIKGPKGDVIASGNASSADSVWSFAWDIPSGQAGGEYKILATYPWDGHSPAERKFDIRAYRAPRLKSQITFVRDGYGPGEKVKATLDVKRAEGGVPAGAKVTVTARIDGTEVSGGTAKVDANGLCNVEFDLPRDIPRGEGTLALTIQDGGVVETASKTIPILLQTVDIQFYPEGGDLVSGFKNRVYVQAKQPNGKPADLLAKLIEGKSSNKAVAHFKTEHEGRGRFEFIPETNKEYYVSIEAPAGIKTKYKLPAIRTIGAVIHADSDVYGKDQPVTVHAGCTDKSFRVTLKKQDVELAASKVDSKDDAEVKAHLLHPIKFALPSSADGVLTVTVWNKKNEPVAERVIFRQPAHPLKVSIKADKEKYTPGESAKLTVKTTDEAGKPVSSVVGITVTDDSVLEMIEKREQAPRLPVMAFIEPEVEDLADAHVYMDPKNPKAPLATDLLLGTQGWRRFALVDLPKFVKEHGDQARRAVAMEIRANTEIQSAMVANVRAADGFRAIPPAAMPMPQAAMNMAMVMHKGAMRNAGAPAAPFMAPRQMQILEDRPIVRDFRQKPMAQKREVAFGDEAGAPMMGGKADKDMQDAIAFSKTAEKKKAFSNEEVAANLSNLAYVREYAHQTRANRQPTDRTDFTETVFWNAGVKTSEKTGEATVKFALNDSVTTFKAFADAFSNGGAIGAANTGLESVQPFYAEAKLPLEVTAGDKILLPVSLVNASERSLNKASENVSIKGEFNIEPPIGAPKEIGSGKRLRYIQPIKVGFDNGAKQFTLSAKAGPYEDKIVKTLSVKPKGFPIECAYGGMLAPNKSVTHTITIPKGVVPMSMTANTAVYPTPLANLTEALERMIQDPYGCFEQTSSTSYPLTMAQQYFVSHTGIDPKIIETSKVKLDAGYKRLVGYWCPDRGYEWFGENPGHEALTAFGLLHFSDMSKVREVDQNMIVTTREWLLKQKDGHGGFSRKRRSLHSWIEDKDCSNAYIVWALLESGQSPAQLKDEIAALKTAASASQNSYVQALAANALELAGEKEEARKLMDKLVAKQKADGSVGGITASIVGSYGDSLEVEGTSLATLAWLRQPAYAGCVEKSIKYLADSCKSGRYGSTQATVLALRAIVNYDKQRARPKVAGKVRVYVDGQSVGDWQEFTPSTQGAIKLPNITELLSPGTHKLELRMENGGAMPYSMSVRYNAMTPESAAQCKIAMKVKLAQDKLTEGSPTEANLTVTNTSKDAIPSPVAIVGLPGGLEPRHDQLKELVKKGTIDAYEVLGREVVLYWRALPGAAKVQVPISLIAAVPGSYTGPASRAYLYYADEHKNWVDGLQVDIAAK